MYQPSWSQAQTLPSLAHCTISPSPQTVSVMVIPAQHSPPQSASTLLVCPSLLRTASISHLIPLLSVPTAWHETGSGCGYPPLRSPVVTLSPPLGRKSWSESSMSCQMLGRIPPASRIVLASWSTMCIAT